MAGKPPIGSDAAPVTTTAIDARVEIDLDDVYTRLLNETRRLLSDYGQQPLSSSEIADAVEAGLNDLGTSLISQKGRGATAEAFNLGRNQAVQAPAILDNVDVAVRVEVLDQNTCDPCASLDGKVVQVNSPEYFEFMPPNQCNGGDFCRGFYLYRAAA